MCGVQVNDKLYFVNRVATELPFASMQNHSYENVLPLQLYFHANQSHFHMKGFARTLVLTQKYKEMAYDILKHWGQTITDHYRSMRAAYKCCAH